MAIQFEKAPNELSKVLREGARLVGSQGDKELADLMTEASDNLDGHRPHKVFTISQEAALSGDVCEKSELVGWRYLLDTEPIVAVEVHYESAHKEFTFSDISIGPLAHGSFELISDLVSDATLDRDYVISMIRIPGLQINMLWLRAQEQEKTLFVALNPTLEAIFHGERFTKESFNQLVQKLTMPKASVYDIMDEL